MKGVGMLVGNFELTNLSVAQPFFAPKSDHFKPYGVLTNMVFVCHIE